MSISNNSRIEETATTVLKACLLKCPILHSYIDINDKTPSWDGNVFVYKNESQKKDDFLGKVPVQIKGTTKFFKGETATYSCDVVDLKNYYRDGGCIFFLISVNPETGESIIFYVSLLVYDLKKLIDKSKKQKTLAIQLSRFPQNNINEISSIFLSFVENAKKQSSFIGKDFSTLNQLKAQGFEIDKLTFNASGLGLNIINIGDFITTHDFYLYAKPKGLDIEIPIDKISDAVVSRPVNGNVIVNNKKYYSSYAVVSQKGQSMLKLGKGITIKIDEVQHKVTVTFNPSGSLSDFICDAECFISIAEYKGLYVNGAELHLDGLTSIDLTKYKNSLHYYKDVKRMLDFLGVTEELQCSSLTDKDEINIRNFINATLYNNGVRFLGTEETTIYGAFVISNLSIWIWATRQENGKYSIENFFTPHSIAMFENTDITNLNPINASQYLLLNKEAFMHTSNMDYDAIKRDIQVLKPNPLLANNVLLLVLDVIRAYDEQTKKNEELLDLGDSICDWLSISENGIEKQVLRLNQLQIIKRRRKLTIKERIELGNYTDETNGMNIRCGAYLLLDEPVEAQKCFDKLTIEAQNEFVTYPICHFGKMNIHGGQNNGKNENGIS